MRNMEKKTKTWLCFMVIPFIVGIVLHFLIPIHFILLSDPKIETIYNVGKVQIEQETLRGAMILNNEIIRNQFQLYSNVHQSFMAILNSDSRAKIVTENIKLNNGKQLREKLESQEEKAIDIYKSMYVVKGERPVEEMTERQKYFYNAYIKIQPFIHATLQDQTGLFQGIQSISTFFNKDGQYLYLQYPSRVLNFPVEKEQICKKYQDTLEKKNQTGESQTIFFQRESLSICESISYENSIIGVNCLKINLRFVIRNMMKILSVPQYRLSDNQYMIVQSIQGIDLDQNPKIWMRFSDKNLDQLTFSQTDHFLIPNNIPRKIFTVENKQKLTIFRSNQTITYYIIPISICSFDKNPLSDMFMVIENNFQKADLNFDESERKMILSTSITSCTLGLTSVIATILVLRSLLKNIQQTIEMLNNYSALILKGDLQLIIPEQKQNSDFAPIFQEFSKLNQLSKYSDSSFFNVPKPQRIIKYFKCLKLFRMLGYDLSNLYQNIGDCYTEIKDFENGLKFLKISIQETLDSIRANSIWQNKSKWKGIQKKLCRKIDKFVNAIYSAWILGQKQSEDIFDDVNKYVQILKKINTPKGLNLQYLICLLVKLRIKTESVKDETQEDSIQEAKNILILYQEQYKFLDDNTNNYLPPPDILRSHWRFIKAKYLMKKNQTFQAFQHYVLALSEKIFDPYLHQIELFYLKKLLQSNQIKRNMFSQMKFQRNYDKRENREYTFLIDICSSKISQRKLKKWKRNVKNIAKQIFQNFVDPNDRVSILKYSLRLKVLCNLYYKIHQEKVIERQLLQAIDQDDLQSRSNTIQCLMEAIQRVHHLESEKVFLIFLRPNTTINGDFISQFKSSIKNSIFIFFIDQTSTVLNWRQGFYVLKLNESEEDVKNLLQEKSHKPADISAYVF